MTPFYSGHWLLTPAFVRRNSTWPRGHFVPSSKYNFARCLLLFARSWQREPRVCICGRFRDVIIKSTFLFDWAPGAPWWSIFCVCLCLKTNNNKCVISHQFFLIFQVYNSKKTDKQRRNCAVLDYHYNNGTITVINTAFFRYSESDTLCQLIARFWFVCITVFFCCLSFTQLCWVSS